MRASPASCQTSRSNPGFLRLALGIFLVRALIPVGFMPAPLDAGGPFTVCHGGLAGALFEAVSVPPMADHSAAMHHEHAPEPGAEPNPAHDGWEHCPFGAASGSAPLGQDFRLELLSLNDQLAGSQPADSIPVAVVSSYRARAPPSGISRRLI